MSRQEIDRILNSDITEFDHSIDRKLNSIEQITGQLSEKSNFLAQFQLLLQKELGKAKKVQQQPFTQVIRSTDEFQQTQVRQQTCSFKYSQIGEQGLSFKQQSSPQSLQNRDEAVDEPNTPPFVYPQIKQQPKCNHFQTKQHLKAVIIQIQEFKLLFNFLKEQIKGQIEYFKSLTLKHIEQSFFQVISKERQKYKQQIKNLNNQIVILKQANIIKNNNYPFTDITSTKLNEVDSMNISKRLKQQSVSKRLLPTNIEKINSPSDYFHGSDKLYTIPDIKPLTVGVPPVKNGFGVLKLGNKVIYKGMWKEGKFQGSGKLTWDDYCYQGTFLSGMFEGYGRLQLKDMSYVGKFEAGKVSGEGTLQIGYNKVIGIWKTNKLIRIFQ